MKIQEVHELQQKFFHSNSTKDIPFRIEQLEKLKRILKENEESLYRAIYEDFGKSEFETYVTELSFIYHEINVFIKNIKKWGEKIKVPTGLAGFPAKSYILPEPLGVTLVIGAWNYPYQLSLLPTIASLGAGNTVTLKPSELPSRTSEIMAEIINNNFPAEYLHVVEGGVEEMKELLELRFDKIFFTGSIPVGKIIYQAAAKHLTPVTLELGGKSPVFVLADADINVSVKRIVWAKFLNAGQTCVAPDYILVEQSIEQKFLLALKKEIEEHYIIEDDIPENYLRIINDKHFDRLCKLIDTDKIYCGGKTNKDKRIIHPTVLQNVSFEDEVMQDEIFGPILPIISFTHLDDAIEKVKQKSKPLSCYIYAKNRTVIKRLLKEISFGGGCVNESLMHLSNSHLPFGGIGFSGMGSYHGKYGFDTFSHYKSILDKPFWLEPNTKYAPYSKKKLNILKRLLK